MKTTICRDDNGQWIWCSSSYTATINDPLRDHTADLPSGVYGDLEYEWDSRPAGTTEVESTIDGVRYRLSIDD